MKTSRLISAPVLIAAICLLVGCNQQQVDDAKQAADDVKSAASDAAEAAGEAAGQLTDALGEGFAAATSKAAAALEGVEGGGEVLQKVKDFFGSAQKTLRGITDGESADAAISQFRSLSGSLDGWSTLIDQLPAEAKSAVQTVIGQGMTALKTIADKVMALPGVSEKLQPMLDELMNKLQSFAG